MKFMICSNCGTENPENARFCKQCGSKLVRVCANCGSPLAEDARFCNHCGAPVRADAAPAPAPAVPNAPAPAVYCPAQAAAAYAQQPAAQPTPCVQKDFSSARRVLRYLAESFAFLAAAAAFIFVFLVGTMVNGSTDNVGDSMLSMTAHDIFYYFGQAYRDIAEALDQVGEYPGYLPTSLYLSTVFGTIAAAVMLISTAILFAFTLARFIRFLQGKTQKSAAGLAAATFFSFLAGAMLFLAAGSASVCISVTQSLETLSGSAATVLNDATIAGICIGAASLLICVACAIAENMLRGNCSKSLSVRLFSLAQIAVAVIVLVFVTSGTVQFTITEGTSLHTEAVITCGFASMLQLAGSYTVGYQNGYIPSAYADPLNYILGMSVAGFILQFLFSAAIVWALFNLFRAAADGRSRMTLLPVLLTIAAALLVAVFGACVCGSYIEGFGSQLINPALESQILKPMTNIIVISVSSAVLLILTILGSVFSTRSSDNGSDAFNGQPSVPAGTGSQNGASAPDAGAGWQYTSPAPNTGAQPCANRAMRERVLKILASSFAMLAALTAMIFVFFVGLVASIDGSEELISSISSVPLEPNNIFYYFGEAYRDLAELDILTANRELNVCAYLTTALTTASVSIMLVTTLVFFVLALIRFIRQMTGKTTKSIVRLAAAAYFSFVAGALLFFSSSGVYVDIGASSSGYSVSAAISVSFNGATIAGLCVGAAMLAACLGCSIPCDERKNGVGEAILRYIGGIAQIVVFCVLFILIAQGCSSVISAWAGSLSYDAKITIGGSFLGFYALTGGMIGTASEPFVIEKFNGIAATSVIGFTMMIAIAGIFLRLLPTLTHSVAERRQEETRGLAIAAAVLIIACSVIAIVSAGLLTGAMREVGERGYSWNVSFWKNIIIIVLALIVLVFSCIDDSLALKFSIRARAIARANQSALRQAPPYAPVPAQSAQPAYDAPAPVPAQSAQPAYAAPAAPMPAQNAQPACAAPAAPMPAQNAQPAYAAPAAPMPAQSTQDDSPAPSDDAQTGTDAEPTTEQTAPERGEQA